MIDKRWSLQAQVDDDDVAVGVEERGGYMEEFFQEVSLSSVSELSL